MQGRRLREYLHRAVVKARSDGILETILRVHPFITASLLNGVIRLATDEDDFLDDRDLPGRTDARVLAEFNDAESVTFSPPRNHNRNPFFVSESVELSFDRSYVGEVDAVTLTGHDAIKLTDDGGVLVEDPKSARGIDRFFTSMYREVREEGLFGTIPIAAKVAANRTFYTSDQTFDTVFPLVGFPTSFYHWVVEYLPRLRELERYKELTGVTPTVLLPANPPEYVVQSIELLGYSTADWTTWVRTWSCTDTLVYLSQVRNGDGIPHPASCRWLRDSVCSATAGLDVDSPDRIYVDREDARERRVTNRSELDEVLKSYGFECIALSEHPFEEQVALFKEADSVVGPHGAGLVHLIFGSDLNVVELFGDNPKNHYYALSTIMGHDYYCLQGSDSRGVDIDIDVDEIETILEDIVR